MDSSDEEDIQEFSKGNSFTDITDDAKPTTEYMVKTVSEDKKIKPYTPDSGSVFYKDRYGQYSLNLSGCDNVQVGSYNVAYVGRPMSNINFGKKKTCSKNYDKYKESKQIITANELKNVSQAVGRKWRQLGRELKINDASLDIIKYDYKDEGLEEICHQTLRKWLEKSTPQDCTVGVLATALLEAQCHEAVEKLPCK